MKKISFLTCIVLMLFTACENESFFEFERPVQSPWNTLSEFDRAAIGGYSGLFQSKALENPYTISSLYKNAEADDVSWISAGDSWGYFRDTENQKQFLPNVFVTSYKVICSVNDAFEFVEENGGNPYPTISDDDKRNNLNRVIGELYFLRGYAYYLNATIFCNAYVPGGPNDAKQIPLILKTAVNYTDAVNPKIGTVGEVWEQIQSDFEKAYELLPERYIAGKMNVSYQAGRANKFAAAAMLARTHFAMGNYAKAKEYTDFVIDKNGGDYNLSEDPIQAFNKGTLSRGKESILWIPFYDQATATLPYLFAAYNHRGDNGKVNNWTECPLDSATIKRIGWLDNPKQGINQTFNVAALRDKRFTQLMAIREPNTVPASEQMANRYYKDARIKFTCVFSDKAFRGGDIGTTAARYTNYPLIRLAEMYLTRSICRFKAGDKAGAASDLNVVRKRTWDANVAGQSYESSSNYVTADNITADMIGDERLIEMYGEADRIDYLRGLKENVGNGERTFVGVVPYTDKGFVWTIPTTETDLNLSFKSNTR